MAGFALSITENDSTHFNRLCDSDFFKLPCGRVGPTDERLLMLGDDIRAYVTADADLVKSIAELIMVSHSFYGCIPD